ncbi:hypothetical protein [Enterococcus gallinarum]|uniref:hypothetical protein n=1 Tax=Enterococcus gallinarum TaxID=1353 RepID=UPI001D17A536|nr:hypothetical protein [Enterococcus gallinarum]MCC4046487.1 hypothetical protein [Enterococcus gallinarum]
MEKSKYLKLRKSLFRRLERRRLEVAKFENKKLTDDGILQYGKAIGAMYAVEDAIDDLDSLFEVTVSDNGKKTH